MPRRVRWKQPRRPSSVNRASQSAQASPMAQVIQYARTCPARPGSQAPLSNIDIDSSTGCVFLYYEIRWRFLIFVEIDYLINYLLVYIWLAVVYRNGFGKTVSQSLVVTEQNDQNRSRKFGIFFACQPVAYQLFLRICKLTHPQKICFWGNRNGFLHKTFWKSTASIHKTGWVHSIIKWKLPIKVPWDRAGSQLPLKTFATIAGFL